MFVALKWGWGGTLLAGIAVAGVPVPLLVSFGWNASNWLTTRCLCEDGISETDSRFTARMNAACMCEHLVWLTFCDCSRVSIGLWREVRQK